MSSTPVRLMRHEEGATAIEYGLIVALVSLAAISALNEINVSLISTFDTITQQFVTADPHRCVEVDSSCNN